MPRLSEFERHSELSPEILIELKLSRFQYMVFKLYMYEFKQSEIAATLGMTVKTVKWHLGNCYRILGVKDFLDAYQQFFKKNPPIEVLKSKNLVTLVNEDYIQIKELLDLGLSKVEIGRRLGKHKDAIYRATRAMEKDKELYARQAVFQQSLLPIGSN